MIRDTCRLTRLSWIWHQTTIGKITPLWLMSCPGPARLLQAKHAVLKPFRPANLQVLLPSGRAPNLGCPEHLGDMDMMQQVTPPPKRPPLPRLDIPGAPSGTHLPTSAAHNVSSCTRPSQHHPHGRIILQGADD